MRRLFLFTWMLIIVATASAQFDFSAMGARSAALGGASAALTDPASDAHNIAGWAYWNQTCAGMTFLQQHSLSALNHSFLFAATPIAKSGNAALGYHYYGNSHYNEQEASLAYAMRIGHKRQDSDIGIGVQFNYLHSGTDDPNYPMLDKLTFSAGLLMHLSENLLLGIYTFNPIAASAYNARIPARVNAGIAYQLATDLTTTAEVEKNLYNDPTLRLGVEYEWNYLATRIGMATRPAQYTFGLGYKQKHWAIDIAVQMHQWLGMTPQATAYFMF